MGVIAHHENLLWLKLVREQYGFEDTLLSLPVGLIVVDMDSGKILIQAQSFYLTFLRRRKPEVTK